MKTKILLMLMLTAILPVMAQRQITVTGNVYDRVTTKDLLHAKATILNTDSTVAGEADAYHSTYNFSGGNVTKVETARFSIDVPDSSKTYILRLTMEGYEPLEQPIDLSGLKGRQYELKLPPIYMTPEAALPTVDLDEVVVKSSKVVFYHKGDTVIYNADAFMLPEGSTLDALIAKLPGVEIREGGKIYVNGKYVESLLLNGKDFFKGNQEVMRQNLGAYTVKDIAVYDKTGQMSKLMGEALEDDKEYVMDVRLKKDYMGGFMGSAEASYGTDDRYSGRLFAMHFNNNARFSLYGNINNVNNTNRPREDNGGGLYYSGASPQGILKTTNGGFDYLVEDPRKVWTVNGNVDIKYVDNTVTKNVFTESYLKNNSFQTSISDMRDRPLTISTNHRFKYDKDRYYLNVTPEFSYRHNRTTSGIASAEFDSYVQERHDVDKAVIDAIYTGTWNDLRQAIINRNRYNRDNRSNSSTSHLSTEQSLKLPGSPDAVTLWVEGKYTRDHGRSSSSQIIDYGFNGVDAPASSSASVRENRQYPAYTGWIRGAARYMIKGRNSQYSLTYEYRHEEQRRSSYEFLADTSTEDQEATLPEHAELMPDLGNTDSSTLKSDIHSVKGNFSFKWTTPSNCTLALTLAPVLDIRRRELHYNAFELEDAHYTPISIPVRRTSVSPDRSGLGFSIDPASKKVRFSTLYNFTTSYASLTDLIDIANTTDPLNVWHGNPNLKDASTHQLTLTGNYFPQKNVYTTFHVYGQLESRAIAKGYTFNSLTGVRDFQSVNVDGNRNIDYYLYAHKRFSFGENTLTPSVQFSNSFTRYANMIGEDGPMSKQMVNTTSIMYGVGADYEIRKKYSFSVRFYDNNTRLHMDSGRSDGNKDRNMRITASTGLQLPWNLSFSASMEYRLYRGTDVSGMNPDQCIVDASLSYQINSGWSVKAEVHDLLAQQSPYTNVVSASGRTITIANTLPRYAMLTLTYKFNTKKK